MRSIPLPTPPALLIALAIALVLGAGPSLDAADGPTPYPDAKAEAAWPGTGPIRLFEWMPVNRASFWSQRAAATGAVVFVGDSLTGGWKDLGAAFPGLRVANRGIGGDTSRGLLFRFAEDALDLDPRALVLCIGTNDLSCHADPAGVVANIATMIDQARARHPAMPIALCLVPPRDSPTAPTRPGALADLNRRIAAFGAGKQRLAVVDLATPLTGPDGKPIAACFAADRLHLAAPGYARWADALGPALEGLGIR